MLNTTIRYNAQNAQEGLRMLVLGPRVGPYSYSLSFKVVGLGFRV